MADYEPKEILNVGTVLFEPIDLDRPRWNTNMLNLLQARKYFENIIPSPHTTDTINEEFLDYLLEYFNDSYETIKREVDNPATRFVMTNALSDAIGGYLKVWVLPISKYSYYGGTISLENALKVNKIYDAIKHDLKTDGKGWKDPDEDLLKCVPINIAVIGSLNALTKTKDFTCEDLAYYEKSTSGFTLPLPVVNWEIEPSTMFVPLKNQSLLPLNSISSPAAVIKYYDLIQTCVNNVNWKDFNEKFQNWLVEEVVPHLNDEKLYIPFGGILSLMNKSRLYRGKYCKTLNGYNFISQQSHFLYEQLNFSGKKLILIAILLIELMWCVPTLLYILFCKKRYKTTPLGVLFCLRGRLNRNKYYVHSTSDTDDKRDGYGKGIEQTHIHSFRTFDDIHNSLHEPNNIEEPRDEKYADALCKDEIKSNESKPLLQSTRSKPRPSEYFIQKTEIECKTKESTHKTVSKHMQVNKDKTKNSTQIKASEKVIQNFTNSQFQMQEIPLAKSIVTNDTNNNKTKGIKNKSYVVQKPTRSLEQSRKLEKSGVNDKSVTLAVINNKVRKNISPRKQWSTKTNADNTSDANEKRNAFKPKDKDRVVYKLKQDSVESKAGDEIKITNETSKPPLNTDIITTLQIDIQRPKTVINLGIITNTERNRNLARPSKIPRWSTKTTNIPTESYIIQHKPNLLNRGSFDDSLIKYKKDSPSKLNVTL